MEATMKFFTEEYQSDMGGTDIHFLIRDARKAE